MKILGIQDGYGSSAALIENGEIIAAVQEERITRQKNQGGYPFCAVEEVLKIGDVKITDIEVVAFCGHASAQKHNRRQNIERNYQRFNLGKNAMQRLGTVLRYWRKSIFSKGSLKRKAKRRQQKQQKRMRPLLNCGFPKEKIQFVEHHLCHAATAYFGQGNMEDKVLTVTCDVAGDDTCATVYCGHKGKLQKLVEIPKDDSLAMLYTLITYMLGFDPMEQEYKVSAISPYAKGAPQTWSICNIFHTLFSFADNPLVWRRSLRGRKSAQLASVLKRVLEYQRFDHIAAGLQTFIEDFMLQWVSSVLKNTKITRLALAGEMFENARLNKLIMELPGVESLFIFPSCSDSGGSVGAAWSAYETECWRQGKKVNIPPTEAIYWGARNEQVEKILQEYHWEKTVEISEHRDIELECARLLARGEIVARCKGQMEFGSQALGNRSILASTDSWDTVYAINKIIGQEDFWMPISPSMLAECANNYIINPKNGPACYMNMAFDSVKKSREKMAAAIHPRDKICCPHVVKNAHEPDYHRLLVHYLELSGEGIILNAPFAANSPIVYKAKDALEIFDKTPLRYLALENFLIAEKIGENLRDQSS